MENTIKELEQIHRRITELGHAELKKKLPLGMNELIEYLKPLVNIERALGELIIQLKAEGLVNIKPEHVIPLKFLKDLNNGNND